MSQKQLSVALPPEVYDAYIAAKPDDVSINKHVRGLIEAFTANPAVAIVAERYIEPAVAAPDVLLARVPFDRADLTWPAEPFIGSATASGHGDTLLATRVDPDACNHPKATLVREGHLVRCTLCNKIVR